MNNLVPQEGPRVYKCASPGGRNGNSGLNHDEAPPHETPLFIRRVRMTPKIIQYAVWTGMLVGTLSVSHYVPSLRAQQSATSVTDARQEARGLCRRAEA